MPIHSQEAIEFDEVMTRIGFGYIHWRLLITCALLFMLTASETMGMAIIAPASQCDLDTTPGMRSALKSAAFFGMICASYFWGFLCDLIGRWRVLMFSTISSCVISILSMFMPTFTSFLVLRFLVGCCVSGPGFATLTYLGELCTNKYRPHMINYMSLANGIAMIYCPTLATFVLQEDWYLPLIGPFGYCPWRFLGFLFTLPGLIGIGLLVMLPESPVFYLCANRIDEAYAVMDWICIRNRNMTLSDLGIDKLSAFQTGEGGNTFMRKMLVDAHPIFHKPYLGKFLLSCAVIFGLVLISNGMGLWFTDMRNRIDLYKETEGNWTVCSRMTQSLDTDIELDAFVCNDSFKTFRDSIIMGLAFIILYNILGFLLFYFNRKPVFMGSLIVSGFCGFMLNWAKIPNLISILFVTFLAIPGVVINLIGGAMLDFVPAHLRGKTMCFCMMFGRCGAIFGANILGYFLDDYCLWTFNLFSGVPWACALLGEHLPLK